MNKVPRPLSSLLLAALVPIAILLQPARLEAQNEKTRRPRHNWFDGRSRKRTKKTG